MNKSLSKIALAAALLTGLAVAQAHTAVGANDADTATASQIKTALMQAAPFQDSASDIKVSVRNGNVDLSGWISYANDEGLARSIAQSVSGVHSVNATFHAWSVDNDARIGVAGALYDKAQR